MYKTFFGILVGLLAAYVGFIFGGILDVYLGRYPFNKTFAGALFGIIGFIASDGLLSILSHFNRRLIESVQRLRPSKVISAVSGALVGLIFTVLFITPFYLMPFGGGILNNPFLSRIFYLGVLTVFVYLFTALFAGLNVFAGLNIDNPIISAVATPKVLDSNTLIDGRIYEVLATGFVDGPFIIPTSVLKELQFIADAHDPVKREKGRRGLDLVKKMLDEPDIQLRILEEDFRDVPDVDSAVIKVARSLRGSVITNDYNLNKLATAYGVKILNINDLTNAIKPLVHHGEVMTVEVVKYGKEPGQGVAYLEDGTMIVVEEGEEFLGKKVDVVVTSVLQTSAGRIIFTRPFRIPRH